MLCNCKNNSRFKFPTPKNIFLKPLTKEICKKKFSPN